MIRKLIFISLLFALVSACEEIPSGTIEPQSIDYAVIDINAPTTIIASNTSSSFITNVKIKNAETVKNVWFDLGTVNGSEFFSVGNIMTPNVSGDITNYSAEFQLDPNLLSGFYEISYFVEDNIRVAGENIKRIGTKQFELKSEAENFPPSISNLDIPIEVDRGVSFIFSIKAADPNGLSDIAEVYFELKRPDGSIVYLDEPNNVTKFPMFDNGDIEGSGDQTVGDGIYSLKNSFGTTSQVGDWNFTFGAVDKSGAPSNTISHTLKVN